MTPASGASSQSPCHSAYEKNELYEKAQRGPLWFKLRREASGVRLVRGLFAWLSVMELSPTPISVTSGWIVLILMAA